MEVRLSTRYLVGLIALLLAANGGLAALVRDRYSASPPPLELPSVKAADAALKGRKDAPGAAALAPGLASADIDLIVSKNLFHPSRSRVERMPEQKKTATKPVDTRYLQVLGIFLEGAKAKALLLNQKARKGEDRTAWLAVGQSLWGLKVLRIEREKVQVEVDGQSVDLGLYEAMPARDRGKSVEPAQVPSGKGVTTVGSKTEPARVEPRKDAPTPEGTEAGRRQPTRVINTPFGKVERPVAPNGAGKAAPAPRKSLPFPSAPKGGPP